MTIYQITCDREKIIWRYDLKDMKTHLTRWYKKDAEKVVHVECCTDGITKVRVPISGSPHKLIGISEDKLRELIPSGSWGLVDLEDMTLIRSPKITDDRDYKLWGTKPIFGDSEQDDYRVYLAGTSEDEFVTVYGGNRNLILSFYAQSAGYWVFRKPEQVFPRTNYGVALAMQLVLAKAGLPPITYWSGDMDRVEMLTSSYEKPEIKAECIRRLLEISREKVTPVPVVQAEIQDELIPADPSELNGHVALLWVLDDSLNLSLDKFHFPVGLDFEFFIQAYPSLSRIESMILEGKDSVSMKLKPGCYASSDFIEEVSLLLYDMYISIREPNGVLIQLKKASEDEEDDNEPFA